MSRSVDETRREFLLRLARTAAFVPPAVLSMDVERAGASPAPTAQGQGRATQEAAAAAQQQATQESAVVGALTPTAALVVEPAALEQEGAAVPWNPGATSTTPPWARRPPTQTGG